MARTLPLLNATALTEGGEDPVVTKYYFRATAPAARSAAPSPAGRPERR